MLDFNPADFKVRRISLTVQNCVGSKVTSIDFETKWFLIGKAFSASYLGTGIWSSCQYSP